MRWLRKLRRPRTVFVLTFCDLYQYQGANGFRGAFASEAAAERALEQQLDYEVEAICDEDDDQEDRADRRNSLARGFFIEEVEVAA